jgi:hypothetical protein
MPHSFIGELQGKPKKIIIYWFKKMAIWDAKIPPFLWENFQWQKQYLEKLNSWYEFLNSINIIFFMCTPVKKNYFNNLFIF